jgi:hypothetical protein
MIISTKHRFVFLCMPKCASTSTEAVLRPYGQIVTGNDPGLKHLPFRAYERYFSQLVKRKQRRIPGSTEGIEVVCLFREPVEWLNSWYRYRTREELAKTTDGRAKSTANISFEDFAREYVSPSPRPFAKVGRQINFVKDKDGNVGKITLFRYEDYDRFIDYMSDKVGKKLVAPHRNVSPRSGSAVLEKPGFLVDFLRDEYQLYDSIGRGR